METVQKCLKGGTMTLPVDPKTLAAILQLGGQYMLPIAAILRALYSGARGKTPEGAIQIATAAIIAGVSAGVNGQQPDIKNILNDVLSNTVFTAGLLAFIVVYLPACDPHRLDRGCRCGRHYRHGAVVVHELRAGRRLAGLVPDLGHSGLRLWHGAAALRPEADFPRGALRHLLHCHRAGAGDWRGRIPAAANRPQRRGTNLTLNTTRIVLQYRVL